MVTSHVSFELLWRDLQVFSQRHEKSADYLAAIREVVASEQFGGAAGDEFLRVFDYLAAVDQEVFTAVWTDPAAYLWVRTAYQLLGAHFGSMDLSPTAKSFCTHYGTDNPADAAARHLEQFKLFAVGAALRVGEDFTFAKPLAFNFPVTIPGTRLSIDGEGSVTLLGVHRGKVLTAGPAALWRECPRVHCGERDLRMQAALFRLPSIGYGEPLRQAGPEYQHEQAGLLSRVLSVITRYAPEQIEQLVSHLQVVVLKPASLGDFSNVSHSELPGACILAVLDDPVIMADRLIHELHHHRLFCLEEHGGALFDAARQDSIRDARFYSPWRDDPRPLHGLLHAFYVFQPVWHFWRRVRDAGAESASTLAFAEDQLRRIPLQLQWAASTLDRHGVFTEYGQAVFAGMCHGAEEIVERADEMRLECASAYMTTEQGAVVPQRSRITGNLLTVEQAVNEHVRRYEQKRADGFPAICQRSRLQSAA